MDATPAAVAAQRRTLQPIQVDVVVRVRPLLLHEQQKTVAVRIKPGKEQNPSTLTLFSPDVDPIAYNFIKCYNESVTQRTLFQQEISPAVDQVFAGRTATVLAYGAAGADKTFTMEDSEQSVGVIPRCIRRLLRLVEELQYECEISVSYVQIYKNKVQDLLATGDATSSSTDLPSLQQFDGSEGVQSLTKICVTNASEWEQFYERGRAARETGAAWSHSILMVHVRTEDKLSGQTRDGKLHLIDLAGCGRNASSGSSLEESNSSLLMLGDVISALNVTGCSLPSRGSKLTQFLQDSLGGSSHVVMICNVSPSVCMFLETQRTLNFAQEIQEISVAKDTLTPAKSGHVADLLQKSPLTPASIISKGDGSHMKTPLRSTCSKNAEITFKASKVVKSKKRLIVYPMAQRDSESGEIAGSSGKVELTMEEKLRRWKQSKQNTSQSKKISFGGCERNTAGNTVRAGGIKRKLTETTAIGCLSKITTTKSQIRNLPVHKNPRSSVTGQHKSPVSTASPKFVASSSRLVTNVKTHRLSESVNCSKTPMSAPEEHISNGSAECPIVIDDDIPTIVSQDPPKPRSPVAKEKVAPAPKKNDQDMSIPTSQPPLKPSVTASEKLAPMPKENRREMPTALNQDPPKKRPTSVPVLNQNDREVPISTNQALPEPSPITNGKPAMDKENQTELSVQQNQNLPTPVITVEKKSPELLAKDLIRVAIGFEKRHRMATAYSMFKRACHILPKKSSKLAERLTRLADKWPAAVAQVPPQEWCTSAYILKVLKLDLLAVLNHGTTKELTELHTIGAKRAELVIDKRPFQQLEELQRVPGISANVVARLYEHHTNWKNHQRL